ncbi:MAG TPA: alanine--tRNA ligase, partial [Phycisphaerales bacterium]|nr:alanine--tRNA ligase [Phycisphaerales bacterium]
MRLSASQIRSQFIDFFVKKCGHTFVPSSPVVPHDDPTLLFTNAGMNQFKPVFLNQVPPGSPLAGLKRAVNSQKCIRAGGKHNDLEDVGRDTYHHTFFEMLGNWSFGDYFKKEAIDWAWELVVNTWKMDPKRIHATYFQGDAAENLEPDNEARDLWLRYLPADHVHPGNKKDNFWEMGDTGPCGPCSEMHYDGTPDASGGNLVNAGDPNVIEFWNLVFIQFNRGADGKLTPLPAKHVDTGMGFERIVRILQHSTSNYDTDVWSPIFMAIEQHTGAHTYTGKLSDSVDIAYRVVADHIRCLTVAITDGARPSNEGRGYVLRRILRRAVRMAHQYLGAKGPFLCELVPAVVNSLGEAFPELKKDPKRIAGVIREEEEAFLKTLDRGLALQHEMAEAAVSAFREMAMVAARRKYIESATEVDSEVADFVYTDLVRQGKIKPGEGFQSFNPSLVDWSKYLGSKRPTISAADAFKLHDTYGFPIDLTRVMAEERGLTVDVAGFEKLMDEAREKSRSASAADSADINFTLPPDAFSKLAHLGVKPTDDSHKFAAKPVTADVLAIWNGTDFDEHAHIGRRVAIILNRTNHYAEQGGQVGDKGEIRRGFTDMGTLPVRGMSTRAGRSDSVFHVEDTQSFGGYVLHIGRVSENQLSVNDRITITVDHHARDPIQSNHTTTHLLNHALREALGDEVHQKGSLVAADRLRFDFSHNKAVEESQLMRIEADVNAAIVSNQQVYDAEVPLTTAKTFNGVRAVFGERYPDPVRVVSIGVKVTDLLANPANPAWRAHSIEFCGGTHLHSTNEARQFIILSEGALAAG